MNLIDVVIILVIACILGLIIYRSVKRMRRGETPGCNCGCSGCPSQSSCHKEEM